MAHIRFPSSQAIFFLLAMTLVTAVSFSQNTMRDVVYLKNGSIVKGLIIEQVPNKSLKIQTADGNIFFYDFSEVDKILKETTPAPQAQIYQKGFFMEGNATILMLNGTGELSDKDLNVTDDIFKISETSGQLDIQYKGWSWGNKFLYGLKPLIGYRFSPQFAVSASYGYYLKKSGEQAESYTSRYISGLNFIMNSDMEYSQSVIQLLGHFHPIKGSGFFLSAGIEFVSITAEIQELFTVRQTGYSTESDLWKAKGDDNATGFVLGGGIEVPAFSQNISFIAKALYSFTNYDGDDLLVVKNSGGPVANPNIDMKLGVGGLSGSIGLRFYLSDN
jgi:hypothetical protein